MNEGSHMSFDRRGLTRATRASKRRRAAAAALFAMAFGNVSAAPTSITGRVVYVDDGDTLIVKTATGHEVEIRLASIDAPEVSHANKEAGRVGQPFGQASKHFLATIVGRREVIATCFEEDRYGREDCDLLVDGQSVNREMVAAGMAWANLAAHGRYLRDAEMLSLQRKAQQQRAGLWVDSMPIAPWEWRTACWKRSNCPSAD